MKNSSKSLTDNQAVLIKSHTGSKWLKLVSNAFSVGALSLSVALSTATAVSASEQLAQHPFVVGEVAISGSNKAEQSSDQMANNSVVVTEKVNINSANFEQLVSLPGIGKVKATAIMDYRETVGPFNSTADIQNIKGIGAKLYAKLNMLIEI